MADSLRCGLDSRNYGLNGSNVSEGVIRQAAKEVFAIGMVKLFAVISHPEEFAHYCCELLCTAGPCTARRMFGGHGISTGGLTLALVADLGRGPTLWLKAGPDTRAVFETAGCQRFTYQAKGKARSLGFYSAPVEAMESAHEMVPWAHLALQAAIAARQPKKARSRKKK